MDEQEKKMVKARLNALHDMKDDALRTYHRERWALRFTVFSFLTTLTFTAIHLFLLDKPAFGIFFSVLSLVNWWTVDRGIRNLRETKALTASLRELEKKLLRLMQNYERG